MLDKTIEDKSKMAFQSFTNIQEIDARYWKSQKPNKKEKFLTIIKTKSPT